MKDIQFEEENIFEILVSFAKNNTEEITKKKLHTKIVMQEKRDTNIKIEEINGNCFIY